MPNETEPFGKMPAKADAEENMPEFKSTRFRGLQGPRNICPKTFKTTRSIDSGVNSFKNPRT
jgi:hypothetical protein